MHSHMPRYRWAGGKLLLAELAAVRLFACVNSHVQFHVCTHFEMYSTNSARVQLLVCFYMLVGETVWFCDYRVFSVKFSLHPFIWSVGLRLFLYCTLSLNRIQKQSLIFAVVTSLISRTQLQGFSVLLQCKLLFLLTGREFLLFFFDLWRLGVLFIQTGIPLLIKRNPFSTDWWLWEIWKRRTKEVLISVRLSAGPKLCARPT